MNHPALLTFIQSVHAIFTFLVDCGLLASRQRCQCGTEMVLRNRNVVDGLIWECPLRTCRKRLSIRAGSFFEDSKISLGQWLNIIYLWSIDVSVIRHCWLQLLQTNHHHFQKNSFLLGNPDLRQRTLLN